MWRLIRKNGQVEQVATGTALGVFIGLTPTFGVQMPLAYLAAKVLRENQLAAVLGVWVTNPLTAPFIYMGEFQFGRWLLGNPPVEAPQSWTWSSIYEAGTSIAIPFGVGSLFCGVFFGGITHLAILYFVPKMLEQRRRLRALRRKS